MCRNASGDITGTSKVCTVQIVHRNEEGKCKCFILRIFNCTVLPTQFLELLRDETMIFVGVGVGGDLAKIGIEFHCAEVTKHMKNVINLGKFARKRNVVKNGVISLEKLVKIVLYESISKDTLVRCSKWSSSRLYNEQIIHAATDAIKSLEVYFKIHTLQDLSLRLEKTNKKIF